MADAEAKGRHELDLFRIGGIQISVDLSWIVIFTLVFVSLSAGYLPGQFPGHTTTSYWIAGLAATLLFFVSLLIHELSHSFMANRLGESVKRITLFIFGGMAHLSGEPKSAEAEFKIAVVGPLTSLALGGVFSLIARASQQLLESELVTGVFSYLAMINVALAVFNLLPGYPLDGGRILRAYYWKRTGSMRRATSRAADWGSGIALGLMALGALQIFAGGLVGGLWMILIGVFLRGAARAGYYGVALEHSLAHVRVRDIMVADPATVRPDATVAEAIEDAFLRHGFAGFPVCDDGRALGLLTLSRVQDCPPTERQQRRVADVMLRLDASISTTPSARVSDALHLMMESGHGRLLVVEGDRLRGILTRSAIARFAHVSSVLAEEPE